MSKRVLISESSVDARSSSDNRPIVCPCGCGKAMDPATGLFFPEREFDAIRGHRTTSGRRKSGQRKRDRAESIHDELVTQE